MKKYLLVFVSIFIQVFSQNYQEGVCLFLKDSWCSREKALLIMNLVEKTHPKVCAEIGAFTGSSVLPIAMALKIQGFGRVFAIDAWSNEEAVRGVPEHISDYQWWKTLDMEKIYSQFQATIDHWNLEPYCKTLKMNSEKAAEQIDQIDFLHIDGNFSAEESLKDITLYLPKVKEGGYILLSNALRTIDHKLTKSKAIDILYEHCDLIDQVDGRNTVLFQKLNPKDFIAFQE